MINGYNLQQQFGSCASAQWEFPTRTGGGCKRLGNAWSLNAEIYRESYPRMLKA